MMTGLSESAQRLLITLCVSCALAGCYSFTGGALPPHLRTVALSPVVDNSGFGVPAYREYLVQRLLERFQRETALQLVSGDADARLSVQLQSIREVTATVRPGERERERRLEIQLTAEFYDAVQRLTLWRRSFAWSELYDISGGQAARDRAAFAALDALVENIASAVLAFW
jgi:hypothetical protein